MNTFERLFIGSSLLDVPCVLPPAVEKLRSPKQISAIKQDTDKGLMREVARSYVPVCAATGKRTLISRR